MPYSDVHFSDSDPYLDALLAQNFQAVHGLPIELLSEGVGDNLCYAVLHLLACCETEPIRRRQSVQHCQHIFSPCHLTSPSLLTNNVAVCPDRTLATARTLKKKEEVYCPFIVPAFNAQSFSTLKTHHTVLNFLNFVYSINVIQIPCRKSCFPFSSTAIGVVTAALPVPPACVMFWCLPGQHHSNHKSITTRTQSNQCVCDVLVFTWPTPQQPQEHHYPYPVQPVCV